MPDKETVNLSDHDLLIRLDTRFDEFQKNHSSMWGTFTQLVTEFMKAIENKADKDALAALLKSHTALEKKVADQEVASKVSDGKRNMIINVGELGLKFWGLFVGSIGAIIAIIKAIK